jgi:hypothetical protein
MTTSAHAGGRAGRGRLLFIERFTLTNIPRPLQFLDTPGHQGVHIIRMPQSHQKASCLLPHSIQLLQRQTQLCIFN